MTFFFGFFIIIISSPAIYAAPPPAVGFFGLPTGFGDFDILSLFFLGRPTPRLTFAP